ncbi:MAG: ABC transporter ATP-binding protein, partial [Thaumarchaeota archaeon]
DATVIVITHYARILKFLDKLDFVHVMSEGKMIKEGPKELADELELKGYTWLGIQDPAEQPK